MTQLWELSPLNDIMPDIDNCHVLCFSCHDTQHARAKDILAQAFDHLVQGNPVLGGLITISDDETKRPGTKVLLSGEEASIPRLKISDARDEVPLGYDELKSLGMPRKYLPQALVMPSRGQGGGRTRTTAMRATFIKGECFLAFSTSHTLMDGTSVVNVMGEFAALARRISCQSGLDVQNGKASPTIQNVQFGPSSRICRR